MNSAQRAALNELLMVSQQMSNVCFNWSQSSHAQIDEQRWEFMRDTMRGLQQRYDAARNRYCELEAEAKQSRTAQQMARKGLGRKSTAGR